MFSLLLFSLVAALLNLPLTQSQTDDNGLWTASTTTTYDTWWTPTPTTADGAAWTSYTTVTSCYTQSGTTITIVTWIQCPCETTTDDGEYSYTAPEATTTTIYTTTTPGAANDVVYETLTSSGYVIVVVSTEGAQPDSTTVAAGVAVIAGEGVRGMDGWAGAGASLAAVVVAVAFGMVVF